MPGHSSGTHPGARDLLRLARLLQRRERHGRGFRQHIQRLKRASASRAQRCTAQAGDVGRVQRAAGALRVEARGATAQQCLRGLEGSLGVASLVAWCLSGKRRSQRTCSGASATYQAALRGLSLMKRLRVALSMLQAAVCRTPPVTRQSTRLVAQKRCSPSHLKGRAE